MSYALRALAYEWRGWCDVHVVTDPDQLFGSNAGYLMNVVASSAPHEGRSGDRHRLIVLEDSGELLTGDARRLVGAAGPNRRRAKARFRKLTSEI